VSGPANLIAMKSGGDRLKEEDIKWVAKIDIAAIIKQ
jgi:hypothetical protein